MSSWTEVYSLVGISLRAARITRGMTQEELAHAIAMTRTSICNIEAGRQRCSLDVLYNIAEALGVELKDVLPTFAEVEGARITEVRIGTETYQVPLVVAQQFRTLLRGRNDKGQSVAE